MKIAILGGGVTGLTAAYELSKKNHDIVIIEKGERLGGLAGGFKKGNWQWDLERTYHHIFSNDREILDLAKEIGFEKFTFSAPTTASLFGERNNYRIFPVDSPKDFLFLPELSLFSKLKAGIVLAFLKISPFLKIYEEMTSIEFLKKTMGEDVWEILWEQLFKKKYGSYANTILASFIWARITKRTQKLGYPTGGFQAFVDALAKKDGELGVTIYPSTTIEDVKKIQGGYEINTTNIKGEKKPFQVDLIISTLPYPITCVGMKEVLGDSFVNQQKKRKYLFAINLILKTKQPILEKIYWLNIGAADIPIMCIVQHTNFIDREHYNDEHLCYIAWYVDKDSGLLQKNESEMMDFVLPHLLAIAPHMNEKPEVVGLFKAPFAQPIFDKEFAAISRSFTTPARNVFIANMDMTYPYDRGTNYAVKLGKDVAKYVITNI